MKRWFALLIPFIAVAGCCPETPSGKPLPMMDAVPSPAADLSTDPAPAADMRAPAPVQYFHDVYQGGYDRMYITKSDPARNLCVSLVISQGGPIGGPVKLNLPSSIYSYDVEEASIGVIPGGCSTRVSRLPTNAIGGSGFVSFDPYGSLICPVNFDLVLNFPSGLPGIPESEIMRGYWAPNCKFEPR
jgi:hypothetical protein